MRNVTDTAVMLVTVALIAAAVVVGIKYGKRIGK